MPDIDFDGPDTLRGAAILLVVSLGVTGYGAYDYVQQSSAVENAVEVDATVTEVSVETESTGTGSTQVKYEPSVAFTYEYQGDSYTAKKVFPASISPEYDRRSKAESVVSEYEEGDVVTAYVTPADPSDAFLKRQVSNAPLLAAGIGAVLSIFGAVSVLKQYPNG